MKQFLPRSIQDLSEALCRLPGIGPKTAHRLTFYLINRPADELATIGEAFLNLKKDLVQCSVCFTISDTDPCSICADPERDQTRLMLVEETLDVVAMERTGYSGLYHVLGGVISPINGVGPHDLTIKQLLDRVQNQEIKEIILATDPSLEGEATAAYITDRLGQSDLKHISITRIARGLPVGGDLEYADEMTLRRALEGRQTYRTK